jgi:hypothetical protein
VDGIATHPPFQIITPESVKSSWNATNRQTVQSKTAPAQIGSNGETFVSVQSKLQAQKGSNGETFITIRGKKYSTVKKGIRMPVAAATTPKDIPKPATAAATATSMIITPPNRTCLTEECIQERAALIALAYSDRHDQEWIVTAQSSTPHNYTSEGILLVKNYKAASSTSAGAVLRIATKHGKNGGRAWNRWHHTYGVEYARRHPQRSFLLSSVRDPAARGLSRIFYSVVTQHREQPHDALIMDWLQSNHPHYGATSDQGGFQLSYLTLRGNPLPYISWVRKEYEDRVFHRDLVEQHVQYILQDYDFLLVAERMDESLVALSMVMGVEVEDVLTNDAKVAGSDYAYLKDKDGEHCYRMKRSFRSDRVKRFLGSDEWRARNYGDYLLHAAAIQSLDLTIERLGRAAFETRLVEYHRLKRKARNVCASATFLPCSAKGRPQTRLSKRNCYGDDGGCGYACVDEMLANETRFGVADDEEMIFAAETPLQKSSERTTATAKSSPPPNRTCLTGKCFQETAALIARSFPNRHDKEWIVNAPSLTPHNYTTEGILLVKNHKAASSTAAGVALRIATQYGKNGGRAWNRWHHTKGVEYTRRHPQRSFLLTTVRDPAARGLSRVFYSFMTKLKQPANDFNVMKWLQYDQVSVGTVNKQGGHQLVYLTLRENMLPYISWDEKYKDKVLHQDLVERHVQYILQDYDFILVAERMDESLVALSMVMGVEVGVVLVNDAKVDGSDYAYINDANGERCVTMERSFRSERVKQFLESDEWKARSYGDYLLHAAAIQSLDLTIERLGRAAFEMRLVEYHRLKKKARNVCANATFLPCSVKGVPQKNLSKYNCYGDDSGCGYPCIDEMLANETNHAASQTPVVLNMH